MLAGFEKEGGMLWHSIKLFHSAFGEEMRYFSGEAMQHLWLRRITQIAFLQKNPWARLLKTFTRRQHEQELRHVCSCIESRRAVCSVVRVATSTTVKTVTEELDSTKASLAILKYIRFFEIFWASLFGPILAPSPDSGTSVTLAEAALWQLQVSLC